MLVAHYVGDHALDPLSVRLGWRATRLVQRGDYAQVTHCEAVLATHGDGTVDIGSASVRDGQAVRVKRAVRLARNMWRMVEVPAWSTPAAQDWFERHDGEPYDLMGAWATVMPGRHHPGRWFCNEAVGAAVGLRSPQVFGPAQFAAISFSLGQEVTAPFFAERAQ